MFLKKSKSSKMMKGLMMKRLIEGLMYSDTQNTSNFKFIIFNNFLVQKEIDFY